MYRSTHILALLGYLASLLATVGHAHASGAADESWQPHVHLSNCEHSHHHGGCSDHLHDHHCDDHDHEHSTDNGHVSGQPPAADDEALRPATMAGSGHNSDAVYFSAVDQTLQQCEQKSFDLDQSPCDCMAAILVDFTTGFAYCDTAICALAGKSPAPACARYLTLRTLRI